MKSKPTNAREVLLRNRSAHKIGPGLCGLRCAAPPICHSIANRVAELPTENSSGAFCHRVGAISILWRKLSSRIFNGNGKFERERSEPHSARLLSVGRTVSEENRNRFNGFTIMEMLLAITIFALVITSSFGIFSMGVQIWRRTQGRSLAEHKALLSLSRFGKEVRSMLKTKDETLKGQGDDRSIVFPALITTQDEQGNNVTQYGRIGYRWNVTAKELCRYVETPSDIYRENSPLCTPVAHHLRNIRFRYWLYSGIGKSYSWFDQWDDKEYPQAISISMEMESLFPGEKYPVKREFQETFIIPVGGKDEDEEGRSL